MTLSSGAADIFHIVSLSHLFCWVCNGFCNDFGKLETIILGNTEQIRSIKVFVWNQELVFPQDFIRNGFIKNSKT